jgi:hypothetical protein
MIVSTRPYVFSQYGDTHPRAASPLTNVGPPRALVCVRVYARSEGVLLPRIEIDSADTLRSFSRARSSSAPRRSAGILAQILLIPVSARC